MFGISGEHILILGIILLIFGPRRLPELGNTLGKAIRNFKDAISGVEEASFRKLPEDAAKQANPGQAAQGAAPVQPAQAQAPAQHQPPIEVQPAQTQAPAETVAAETVAAESTPGSDPHKPQN